MRSLRNLFIVAAVVLVCFGPGAQPAVADCIIMEYYGGAGFAADCDTCPTETGCGGEGVACQLECDSAWWLTWPERGECMTMCEECADHCRNHD